MSIVVQVPAEKNSAASLPALIDRAASALVSARSSGEVLEARDMAAAAYDIAKSAGRIAKAKRAHDKVIRAVYRTQADAALIEARAKMRLADEYDAAQERGEVATRQNNPGSVGHVPQENMPHTAADIGLSRKEIHEARILRDAEKKQPGTIEGVINSRVEAGQEPTKASIKKAARKIAGRSEQPPARNDTTDDDAFEGVTLEDEIASLQRENQQLQARVKALSVDDTAKELDKEVRTRQGIEARLGQEMDRASRLDRELRGYGKFLADLRKVLRIEGGRKEVLNAVAALMREAA